MIEHYNLSAYMKVLLQSENQSSDASCPVEFSNNISYCTGYHVGYHVGYSASSALQQHSSSALAGFVIRNGFLLTSK